MKSKSVKIITVLLILVIALSSVIFVGCNEDKKPIVTLEKQNGEPSEKVQLSYKPYFWWNYGDYQIPTPKREGYFFNGWYFDRECTQTAHEAYIEKDTVLYACWTDTVVFPYEGYEPWNAKFDDLFEVTTSAAPYDDYGRVELTVTVTPKGDFTGAASSDSFRFYFWHIWLSNEQFMGEYVSDDIEATISQSITLTKENNFSVQNYTVIVEKQNTEGMHEFIYWNTRTTSRIIAIYDATLQYNHDN